MRAAEPATGRRAPWARRGLLATALLLGGALLWTAVGGWFAAEDASLTLAHGRAYDLADALRRSLPGGPPSDATLTALVEELEDRGLRYVAFVRSTGKVVAQGGHAQGGAVTGADLVTDGAPPSVSTLSPGRYRVVLSPPDLDRGPRGRWPGRRHRAPGPMPRAFVVMEVEPPEAQAIRDRAATSLGVSVAVALVLLGSSVVLWRLGVRADHLATDLERDRQLALLGEMSAVLGHEIRNPLASLKGHAQLLLEKLDDGHAGRRKAELIVREAVRLEELSGHILSFARSGQVDRRPEDPAAIARSAAEEVGDPRVLVTVRGELPAVALDRVRVEQVLVNLLRNACQASLSDDPIELTVSADRELVFEVRDRGPGLEPGHEDRIFQPFHTTRVKGTGLGLAVASRIAEAHGGRIEARNHPQGGATLRVTLPLT